MRRLVDWGTAVDVVDEEGMTPLHWCAENGHAVLAAVLLKAGAYPHVQARDRSTPLHCAASGSRRGNLVAVRVLLAAGASPRGKDSVGRTPLHRAAVAWLGPSVNLEVNLEVARVLLAAGADPGARGTDGKTPRDLAKRMQRKDLTALLEQHQGEPTLEASKSGPVGGGRGSSWRWPWRSSSMR